MESLVITTKKDLEDALNEMLNRRDAQTKNFESHTINKVAKRTGRAHTTIKRFVESGLLKTTSDGRILETEVKRFFNI